MLAHLETREYVAGDEDVECNDDHDHVLLAFLNNLTRNCDHLG